MFSIELPVKVLLSRKRSAGKTWSITTNVYRNADFYTKNAAKKAFLDVVAKKLRKTAWPQFDYIAIKYHYFAATGRKPVDLDNACAVVAKFFQDALVELGHLEDDSCNFIGEIQFKYAGKCCNEPRLIATIEPLSRETESSAETLNLLNSFEGENMQVVLKNAEIVAAIHARVGNTFVLAEGSQTRVRLVAVGQEFTAVVDIAAPGEELPEVVEQVAPEKRPYTGKPRGRKPRALLNPATGQEPPTQQTGEGGDEDETEGEGEGAQEAAAQPIAPTTQPAPVAQSVPAAPPKARLSFAKK